MFFSNFQMKSIKGRLKKILKIMGGDFILQCMSRIPIIYFKNREFFPQKSLIIGDIKKILIVAASPSNLLTEISIAEILQSFGYDVEIFSINRNLNWFEQRSLTRSKTVTYYSFVDIGHWLLNRRLFKTIRDKKIDVVFLLESNWILLPEIFIDIKNETHSLVILWETNLHIWNKHQSDCLPFYDIVFYLDSYFKPLWPTAYVKKAIYLPNCVNDKLNAIPIVTESECEFYACEIGFVGQLYENRVRLFEELLNFDFKIYGPQLQKVTVSEKLKKKIVSPYISIEEKRKFYAIAAIQLDVQGVDLHINSPGARLFEIAVCGGFPLVAYQKDLDEMFHLGKELVCFYNVQDLIEKIHYYLEHQQERKEIATRCRKRILQDHTLTQRMKQMFDMIEQFKQEE